MFSEEKMHKIESRLSQIKCPICGCSKFLPFNRYSQVISYQENEKGELNPSHVSSINCIRVNCISCGYVMLFKENLFLKL